MIDNTMDWLRRHTALSLLALFVLNMSACTSLIPSPTISDTTVHWMSGTGDYKFTAAVSVDPNITVDGIYVRYTRHYWPGTADANDLSASVVQNQPGVYSVTVPGSGAWPKADHVFYEWYIDYRRGQSGNIVARSATAAQPHEFVIKCTAASQLATLAMLGNLKPNFNDDYNQNPAYSAPAHLRPASLLNQGVSFARPGKAFSIDGASLGTPDLLLFNPPPRENNETQQQYEDRITDIIPDTGSTLAGLGYGVIQHSSTRRPSMDCIPSSKWFIHEAGIHTLDGGLALYTVNEDVPGETEVNSSSVPSDWDNPPLGVWHPRLWDLHVWFDASAPGGVVLQEDSLAPIPGLSLDADPNALPNPFFRPETFE